MGIGRGREKGTRGVYVQRSVISPGTLVVGEAAAGLCGSHLPATVSLPQLDTVS